MSEAAGFSTAYILGQHWAFIGKEYAFLSSYIEPSRTERIKTTTMVWGLHASLFTLLGTLYAVFWNIEHAACFFFLKAYYTSLYIRYDPPFPRGKLQESYMGRYSLWTHLCIVADSNMLVSYLL